MLWCLPSIGLRCFRPSFGCAHLLGTVGPMYQEKWSDSEYIRDDWEIVCRQEYASSWLTKPDDRLWLWKYPRGHKIWIFHGYPRFFLTSEYIDFKCISLSREGGLMGSGGTCVFWIQRRSLLWAEAWRRWKLATGNFPGFRRGSLWMESLQWVDVSLGPKFLGNLAIWKATREQISPLTE